MPESRSDRAAFPAPHYVVARQLVVSVSYALLIVYAERNSDSPIGAVLEWWMNESAPWVHALLFFEAAPPSMIPEGIAERVLAYRHVLVGSLGFAVYSIVASRRYWPAWATALRAMMYRAKSSKSEFARLAQVGFHRMILGAVAATFLAIYSEPGQNPSTSSLFSSDWSILGAPILIGVATSFALLAATFRRCAD